MAIYTDYIAAAIMYNLQILPDTLITGIILLAIVLANPALVALAAGAAGTQLLTSSVGQLVMKMGGIGEAVPTSSMDMCNSGFISRSWDRLFRGPNAPELLWHPAAPSVFMSTIGFFFGYGLGLLQLYKEEIDVKVVPRATLIATTIISLLIVIAALIFRISSGCESILGAVAGTLFGLVIGYMGSVALGYFTDRKATNLWGIPLLRDRINAGSPLYICPTDDDQA
jgi:hypothetical protein